MDNQLARGYILSLWNSEKIDKEAWFELQGSWYADDFEQVVRCLSEIMQRQYSELDVAAIFEKHEMGEIIDFLNRFVHCRLESKKSSSDSVYHFFMEELEEFESLAKETSELSKEELSKTAPVLTTRTYLEMCRVVYDAIREWEYPQDISTTFLFCEARLLDFEHEYEHGILGIDWDSPEQFARCFDGSYHREKLFFGGPEIVIHDESACLGDKCYTTPDKYEQWTGYTCSEIYDKVNLYRTVKMYIALRKEGYPIYFHNYEKVVTKLRKEK